MGSKIWGHANPLAEEYSQPPVAMGCESRGNISKDWRTDCGAHAPRQAPASPHRGDPADKVLASSCPPAGGRSGKYQARVLREAK